MTPSELRAMIAADKAAMERCQRMLRDIFAPIMGFGTAHDALPSAITGCGCPLDGPTGCDSCDSYHLKPRAVRRSDVRYSTLDEIMEGK